MGKKKEQQENGHYQTPLLGNEYTDVHGHVREAEPAAEGASDASSDGPQFSKVRRTGPR
jgi:hypothetical protein